MIDLDLNQYIDSDGNLISCNSNLEHLDSKAFNGEKITRWCINAEADSDGESVWLNDDGYQIIDY